MPRLMLTTPSPAPATVTLLCPSDMKFPADAPDTSGPSYDVESLQDPAMLPSVRTALTLICCPAALLHCSDVSDTHELSSHPVPPTRASALAPSVQKLSPTTVIKVADAPRIFTLTASPPVAACARIPVRLLPASPPTARPPAPLTIALSYDTAMLMLIA